MWHVSGQVINVFFRKNMHFYEQKYIDKLSIKLNNYQKETRYDRFIFG